jgi:rhizosphere induced protein
MANGTGTQFTLIFQNNSSNTWTAAVYQQAPGPDVPDAMSLAWFAEEAAPTTQLIFNWTIDYQFVWSEVGTLAPGVVFTASQKLGADPGGTNNQVTFTNEPPFTFTGQSSGPAGSLTIVQDSTIPFNTASIGIGMNGSSLYALPAQPRVTAQFTPTPNYFITFGTDIMIGQVLDVREVISTSAQIIFPPNVFSMTATLNADNSWTVQPTGQGSAALLAAGAKKNPAAAAR